VHDTILLFTTSLKGKPEEFSRQRVRMGLKYKKSRKSRKKNDELVGQKLCEL
jgi:hypothetical protein